MRFDQIIKILICFVIILPYVSTGQVSAANNYNHSELLEYEGYGEAMFESIVEQTTFITGQYTENKNYVNQSIDEIVDYANFWKEDFSNWDKSCNGDFTGCMRGMLENVSGYALTVGDWIKNLFSDFDEAENAGADPVPESPYFYNYRDGIKIIDGYYFKINGDNGKKTYLVPYHDFNYSQFVVPGGYYAFIRISTESNSSTKRLAEGTQDEMKALTANLNSQEPTVSGVLSVAHELWDITIHKEVTNELVVMNPTLPNPDIRTINNYLNDNGVPEVQVPQPKPLLICPDGTKIQMSVSGSTFLSEDGTVMLVNKDGTSTINGTTCSLDWEKQKVGYVDDNASIIDSDGNWLDINTGAISVCLDPDGCKPAELDNSLLEYVKNAYQYATGYLKTATDGLNSLATGARDLTALFGTFFGWLPNEMVVLMASGLGITVGLRLFRK